MDFNGLVVEIGDRLARRDLHAYIGGQQQSGISPSSTFPAVLLFTNPSVGERHGYFDGWHADGFFHYSGEGQSGDQVMRRGNKRILEHQEDGKQLHLFLGAGKGQPVRYAGEFVYHDHYETEAPDNDGTLRKVYVFRLRPEDAGSTSLLKLAARSVEGVELAEATRVDTVPTEGFNTERYYLDRGAPENEAERREAQLVKDFEAFARDHGVRLVRKRIQVSGELKPLFCDLYDETSSLLIECKGSDTREAMRMAIGQLIDYARFVKPQRLAVLLPSRPRADLMDLAAEAGVNVIYRTDSGFSSTWKEGGLWQTMT